MAGPKAENVDATLKEILDDGVIVCVRTPATDGVADMCRAAARGGLRIFEITLTTPHAADIIRDLSNDNNLIVGAGTVMSAGDVDRVADAGGRFALSPVFDPAVMDAARVAGLLGIPGGATPGEILAAHRHGAPAVKVFPTGALGGPDFLRAVRGPLPDIPLIPTSGPDATTIADYVAAGAVAVGVGRDVMPPAATLEDIERRARKIRDAMDAARRAG